MRVFPPGTPVKCHSFDLLLNEFVRDANREFSPFVIKGQLSKADFENKITALENAISGFLSHNKDSIPENSSVIIEPADPVYALYISYRLSFIDINKIDAFLHYQKSIYPKNNFELLLTHYVYDTLKNLPFAVNVERRLELLMQWVKENRNKPSKKGDGKIKLNWHPDYSQHLKTLSKKLRFYRYTPRVSSFEKVFTDGNVAKWLKQPDELAYLLYMLRKHDPPLFSASKGKGHYKIAAMLFNEDSRKLVKDNYISDTAHRLINRNKSKSIPAIVSLDSILKQIFPELYPKTRI